eukprot:CAMPEP_0185794844 /NCGR_PEP_ID=MMETSP1174-20130828/160229_1 /TAXON_ID=35687 /ORGANISM="Dictyocha speculum, Strain CCMP1381" /LENGTH=520 /DNA_ID=CAMNT_0028490093 /DNA_START=85 /DNA_END=1647 /DNA_ORIENTATION=+
MATAKGLKPKISQKTFDETIQENMEELEMEKDEAIADAIEQFKTQGVDLSNIDTSGVDRKAMQEHLSSSLAAIRTAMKAIGTPNAEVDVEGTLNALTAVREACDRNTGPTATINRSLLAMDKITRPLAALLVSDALMEAALETLLVVCGEGGSGPEATALKDAFPPLAMLVLSHNLQSDEPVKRRARKLCCALVKTLCSKSESHKASFVNKNSKGLDALLLVLEQESGNKALLVEACGALRAVTSFDDYRNDFSVAYDTARSAVELGYIQKLVVLARGEHKDDAVMLAALLHAIKPLACNDDSVQRLCAAGCIEIAVGSMRSNVGDAGVCKSAAGLMRNMAGNDSVKRQLCMSDALGLLIQALQDHKTDAALADNAVAALANMCLRSPENSLRIASAGGIRSVTLAMRLHPTSGGVQRQACLFLRNLVGRCPELVEVVLEEGVEELIRAAGTLQGSVDVAYAALRDLGLPVELITLTDSGEIQRGYREFGKKESNFQAVWDESDDLHGNVDNKFREAGMA